MTPDDKAAARRSALAARARLPLATRERDDRRRDAVLAALLEGARVAAYTAFGTEPGTAGLLTPDTLLPVLRPDRDLDWVRPGGGAPLGVDAVAGCDVVLVPALAVDRAGVRLGRGGGSYDRALRRARGLVVALLHEGELVDALPAEPHDVPVHAVALPSGLVHLRGPGAPRRHAASGTMLGMPTDTPDAFADVLEGNARYAAQFEDEGKPGTAARGLAVVTCMDSRIEPLHMLGLQRGDAKIVRNAGARVTDDVLRTLVLAVALLGVERVLVVPHTDCGMVKRDDEQVQDAVRASTGMDARSIDFFTISDQVRTLERDVQRIRSWPFLPRGLPVAGLLYDVHGGRLQVLVP